MLIDESGQPEFFEARKLNQDGDLEKSHRK
jgi:hypothetical protein